MVSLVLKFAAATAPPVLTVAQEGGPGVSYTLQYVALILGAAVIVAIACRRSRR